MIKKVTVCYDSNVEKKCNWQYLDREKYLEEYTPNCQFKKMEFGKFQYLCFILL